MQLHFDGENVLIYAQKCNSHQQISHGIVIPLYQDHTATPLPQIRMQKEQSFETTIDFLIRIYFYSTFRILIARDSVKLVDNANVGNGQRINVKANVMDSENVEWIKSRIGIYHLNRLIFLI